MSYIGLDSMKYGTSVRVKIQTYLKSLYTFASQRSLRSRWRGKRKMEETQNLLMLDLIKEYMNSEELGREHLGGH